MARLRINFINQEGDTFSDGNQITNIDGDTSPTFTAAKGDINNDGYHDFVTNNNDPFPSNIWLNDGGENHFLSVALRGVYANRSGVGSWIHLYTGAEHYVRYTMCGDNFNSQNTSREIFGLGELNAIDSLVIQWNSGTVDVYYNVFADQNLLLIEGASFFVPFAMTASDDPVICIGDSLLLDAGVFEGYLWNTGDTSRYLLAYEPGEYSVLVLNHFGSWMPSDIFVLEIAEVPSLEIVLNPVSCFGEASGSIDVAADQQFLWSYFEWEGNEPGFMLGNIQAGIYYYFAQSSEGCIVNGFVEMLEPPLLELNLTTTNVSCNGGYDGSLNFVVSGGTGAVIVESSSLDFAQLSAGEYSIAVADQNGCTVEMPFAIMEPMPFLVTATATPQHENEADGSIVFQFTGGTPPYSMTDSTVFPLNDLTVSELLAGNYAFTFVDAAGCDYYIDVEIELQTNIHERTLSYVHFYPNPVDRILFSTDIKLKCQLSNMSGAFAGELNFVNGSADVSGLSQGVYCIQCKRWDGYAVFSKIVVR